MTTKKQSIEKPFGAETIKVLNRIARNLKKEGKENEKEAKRSASVGDYLGAQHFQHHARLADYFALALLNIAETGRIPGEPE